MTETAEAARVLDRAHPYDGRPTLRAVMARTSASLLIAVIAPAALVSSTLLLFNIQVAVIAALAWMAGAMCWRRATQRPMSGLLVVALGMMTIKTSFTLATGNTFVYFVQPVFTDALVATVFLGSLGTATPVVARIAPDFYPIDAVLGARPKVRRLFRRLTALWGLVLVAKGSLTLWLLKSQSMVDFVVIKSSAIVTLTVAAVAVTIAMSAHVGRQEGLLDPA
jgi:hypothetical protein